MLISAPGVEVEPLVAREELREAHAAVEPSAWRQLGGDRRAALKAADASELALADARPSPRRPGGSPRSRGADPGGTRRISKRARTGPVALLERLIASGEERGEGS